MSLKSETGVRDWRSKRTVIQLLLGVWTHREIAEAVLGTGPQQGGDVDRLEGKMHKSASHRPHSELPFLNQLVRRLNCAPMATGTSFMQTSIEEFIELLPQDVREQ